jgi:hypothetical protein
MKNWLFAVILLFAASVARAGQPLVSEAPINAVGSVTCLAISTSAWTAVPTTNLTGRVGLYVTVIGTAAANMSGQLGTSTPSDPASYGPILFKPGLTQYHGISDAVNLYLRSLNAGVGSEQVCSQGVKQ